MAHQITQELARELWDQTPHNWNDFCQTLRADNGPITNIDPGFREELCALAQHMQVEGNGFPTSAEKLYHALADHLGVYAAE